MTYSDRTENLLQRLGSRGRAAILAVAGALTLSACATVPTAGTAMRDGGIVMPPGGWMQFCGRNADDPSCKAVSFDTSHLKELQTIQNHLRTVQQVTDERRFGQAEVWQVADKKGDCEDIALLARAQLMAAGWPTTAVRLATAWTEQGQYHTVLTVDGVRDGKAVTLVLDSRFAVVMSWERLESMGYRFHMRQAARGPNWVQILG